MYNLDQHDGEGDQHRLTTIFSEPVAAPPNPVAEFAATLLHLTPRVFVTPALIALNVLFFLVMVASGVSLTEPTTTSLVHWGANFGPRTASAGEWWRLLTCTFIHIGILHLALNMFVLYQAGPLVERLLGNLGFLLVYLICGLAGAMVSLAWNPFTVSAGASGAIFGIYGALLGFVFLRRDTIPGEALSGLKQSALAFIGYNVLFGVLRSGTDVAAHMGGLAAGLICGVAMSSPLDHTYARRRINRAVAVALPGILLIALATNFLPHPIDLQAELAKMSAVEKKSLDAYRNAFARAKSEKMPDEQFAKLVEHDVIAPWSAEHDALTKLSTQRLPTRQKELLSKLIRYMEVRQQGWTLLVKGVRTNDSALIQQAVQKQREAEAVVKTLGAPES